MANPTHRHTRSRRDKRRANWKGALPTLCVCPECSQPVQTHRVCTSCGSYKGRKVLQVIEKEA